MKASRKPVAEKKPAKASSMSSVRQIAAGEFKAKCLQMIRDVAHTNSPLLVTLRGEPLVEVAPAHQRKNSKKKDSFLGRLEGIIEIVGDPDELIKPVFPLEDYDMLKHDIDI